MNIPLKAKPVVLHLVLAAVVIGALLAGLAVQAAWPERRWMNMQLHSAMEALGGLAAIVMAFVLLQRRQEPGGDTSSRLALGFLGMGLLEEFHAVAPLGNGSVLVRSVASLVGSIGFALVWLPESRWSRWTWMPWAVTSGCLAFGLWSLAFPDQLPQMIQAGKYTATAIAPKSLACVLFIAGAVGFLRDFHRSGKSEDYLFAGMALMFGAAELIFTSSIWDSGWWFWHTLRFLTYLLVLGYMSHGYLQMTHELRRNEAYLAQAQRLTRVGSWAWDPSETHNYYSGQVFNIFGLDPAKGTPTRADFLGLYHSEDRAFVEEAEKQLVSEGTAYDIKYRIVRPDGELRWIREVGTPVYEQEVVTGYIGACLDVTEQEQMTQELACEHDRLRLSLEQITELKDKLAKEKLYLEDEIRTAYNFEEIIGESAALKRILKQVETVAPTDSTVLIMGETGTGKELIARAIHNLSKRRERTFVKINCAAIPMGLLESELFGHERGAFTGAIAQKLGRFELAHQGTLFLDEVGDIPLELQSKLLRVLQEQEFERLGSTRTTSVDVRLVAATNQDLAQLVADKQFRSDLYYRLNVFPVVAPPLRDRSEDIPLLVRYFAQKYAQRMNKEIRTIPTEVMNSLTQYPWPGNIRELENFIERSVILSPGPDLHVPLSELKRSLETQHVGSAGTKTLEEAEREHILKVLEETLWVVSGPSGAATRLGMRRTTLQARMQKLGIMRRS